MIFVYSKFKEWKWKKYSPAKRLKVLCAVEKKVAKNLGIEPLKIEIREDENWNCYGAFTTVPGGGQKIVLNSVLLTVPETRFHALETIAHETRHAYQFSVVSRKLKWYEFEAKRWKQNWESYFSSSIDGVMYNNQSVERDAQKYSIKFLKKHKYKNDENYRHTLDAVLGRYNQAVIDAKNEYGAFYKLKIARNIRKNAKIKRR